MLRWLGRCSHIDPSFKYVTLQRPGFAAMYTLFLLCTALSSSFPLYRILYVFIYLSTPTYALFLFARQVAALVQILVRCTTSAENEALLYLAPRARCCVQARGAAITSGLIFVSRGHNARQGCNLTGPTATGNWIQESGIPEVKGRGSWVQRGRKYF
ncbi:hypothetical protein BDW22DRAFT_900953 [Trametopsis cervina]|nr:hypothetical protein BDW22DRAFT_900953 [Trametopsis cervina]